MPRSRISRPICPRAGDDMTTAREAAVALAKRLEWFDYKQLSEHDLCDIENSFIEFHENQVHLGGSPEEVCAKIAACYTAHPNPCKCYLDVLKAYVDQPHDRVS